MNERMTNEQIGWLSEIAAKAANRAIEKGELVGVDNNRAHFVEQVKGALAAVPEGLRGDWAKQFLSKYKDGAYGASVAAHNAFEETLRAEDEAIALARGLGAQAYSTAVSSGEPAMCPYDLDESGDPLDDIRMTAWYDGLNFAQAREEGAAVKLLGIPTRVTIEAEHADGSVTYSIPSPARVG